MFHRTGCMPRINKRTADPQILHQYHELRKERRREHALNILLATASVGAISAIVLSIHPPEPTPYIVGAIAAVGLVVIITSMILTAIWQSYGSRGISLALIGTLIVMVVGGMWLREWLVSLL